MSDPETGDRLLRAVCARPDDDDLRRIWADWLLEQGDPRGEFVQLQSAPLRLQTSTTLARERELLDAHQERWLGPLAGRVGYAEWDRGLLVGCTLRYPPASWLRENVGHPLWAALRSLWLENWWGEDATATEVANFVTTLPSLRHLGGVTPPLLEALIDRAPRLSSLDLLQSEHYRHQRTYVFDAATAQRLGAFSELRRLGLGLERDSSPGRLGWLWDSPLLARVRTVDLLLFNPSSLADWYAPLVAIDPPLDELGFSFDHGRTGWSLGFSKDADGAWSCLRLELLAGTHAGTFSLLWLAELLRTLPRDCLSRVVVDPFPPSAEEIHPLDEALAFQPRVVRLETSRVPLRRSVLYRRLPKTSSRAT